MKVCEYRAHRELASFVDALPAAAPEEPALLRTAATFLGYAVSFASDDATLPEAERPRLTAAYVHRAVLHLRAAAARGSCEAADLERDHFAPLRSHPEFASLVAEVTR
jgi:hypothetical protein